MATGLTTTYNIPFPLSTDPVNVHGDVEDLAQQVEDVLETKPDLFSDNTFTQTNTIDADSTSPALLILQSGSGEALKIGDTDPFVVTAAGNVFVNTPEEDQDNSFAFQVTGNSSISGDIFIGGAAVFEGSTFDEYETFLSAEDPTQDNVVLLPNESTTLTGVDNTATLLNKTIPLNSNTLTGSIVDFNNALQGNDFATLTQAETFENKTITNSTLLNSIVENPTFSGEAQTDLVFGAGTKIVFEGTTDDESQIALDPGDPVGNRLVTLPNATGTVVTTGNLRDAYPPQSGQEDRVLTSNGFDVFWGQGGAGGGGSTWLFEDNTYQASANEAVLADTSTSSFTITLPENPQLGDKVSFVDYADTFSTNPLIVEVSSESSDTIEGSSSLTLNIQGATVVLVYFDSTRGWRII